MINFMQVSSTMYSHNFAAVAIFVRDSQPKESIIIDAFDLVTIDYNCLQRTL